MMQFRFKIWFFLAALLFAAPKNHVLACGHAKSHPEKTEKTCCSDKNEGPKTCGQQNPGCPCDHENGGCHCPGCGTVGGAPSAFLGNAALTLFIFPDPADGYRQAFGFAGHLPEAVFFPIWLPPKIG